MSKIAWLATNEGFAQCEVIEDNASFTRVKRSSGEGAGREEVVPKGTPYEGIFPALYVQDAEPKVWSHKGRSIPLASLGDFKDKTQAEALLRTNQSFDGDGNIRPYVFQPHTSAIMSGIIQGDHIFLIGHKGVGKTSVIEQIAANVGQPMVRINFTGQISVSDLVGSMGFGPKGTYWNDGPVITAMRNGYWLLLDEFDFGDPSVLSIFHPILEARPSYCLKENNGEIVVADPRFRVFATGNSISGDRDGQYVGTQALNAALLDRFTGHGKVVEIKAMTAKQEREVLTTLMPELPHRIAKRATDFAADVRSKHLKGLSTREVLNWCRKILLTKNAVVAARQTFLSVIQNDGVREGVEKAIKAKFGSRVIIGRCIIEGGKKPPSAGRPKTPKAKAEGDEAKPKTVAAGVVGGRTAGSIKDPEEMRAIWKDYKGNGGSMTFDEIEVKYGLKPSNGMNAYRICKKFEAMMGSGRVKAEEGAAPANEAERAEAEAELEAAEAKDEADDEAEDEGDAEEGDDEDEGDAEESDDEGESEDDEDTEDE